MGTIAIVGGHGKIARRLIPVLAANGHAPLALVRNPEYTAELEAVGATVRILDIEASSAEEFGAAFAGADAVVFAAGGGPDGNIERKRTVDLEGSLKSIEGASIAGVRRFLQISAISVDAPVDPSAGAVWAAYVQAKRDADAALRASDLDWTIIRPGGLIDDDPYGRVRLGPEVPRDSIPRADVAALLATALDDDRTIGKQWEVTSGADTIAEAIDQLV